MTDQTATSGFLVTAAFLRPKTSVPILTLDLWHQEDFLHSMSLFGWLMLFRANSGRNAVKVQID